MRSRTAWIGAALCVGLAASACVGPRPGGPGSGDPDTPTEPSTVPTPDPDPTSTTTPDPDADCARDTSLPQPGDVTVDLVLTGKVVQQNGEPLRDGGGHVVLRDRRSNVGSILGEASVNDAGFFLVIAGSNSVPADPGCRDYWLEACAPGGTCTATESATLTAERDVTDLVEEHAGQGRQDVDISDDPLIYATVE